MNAQDVMALTISTTIFRSSPASKFKAMGRTPRSRMKKSRTRSLALASNLSHTA